MSCWTVAFAQGLCRHCYECRLETLATHQLGGMAGSGEEEQGPYFFSTPTRCLPGFVMSCYCHSVVCDILLAAHVRFQLVWRL